MVGSPPSNLDRAAHDLGIHALRGEQIDRATPANHGREIIDIGCG
jgi:hypothetical protein